jgi:hypothetical protein
MTDVDRSCGCTVRIVVKLRPDQYDQLVRHLREIGSSAPQAVHATDGAVAQGTSFIVASAEGAASRGGPLPSSLGMRLASLDIPFNSGFIVEDLDPPAFARLGASPGGPLLYERLDSFDERFGGEVVSSDTAPVRDAIYPARHRRPISALGKRAGREARHSDRGRRSSRSSVRARYGGVFLRPGRPPSRTGRCGCSPARRSDWPNILVCAT